MKRIIPYLLILTLLLCGCAGEGGESSAASSAADTAPNPRIHVTEQKYVSYINEIYTNPDSYYGELIRIEGMYSSSYNEQTKTTYHYVYRVGPGCCGNDGKMCGFEFTYDGEMPEKGDWISVIGTLGSYYEGEKLYLTLSAVSITPTEAQSSSVK